MPQINYFFTRPDYYYEFDNDDLTLGIKDPQTGNNLTFFEILTGNMLFELFIDKILWNLRIVAVTKDGPNIYLLAENRRVIQLKLRTN